MKEGSLEQLLPAAVAGDAHAFDALWQAANPMLSRYLQVAAGDRADAAAAAVWFEAGLGFRAGGHGFAHRRRWLLRQARRCAAAERRQGAQRPQRRAVVPSATLPQVGLQVALERLSALPHRDGEVLVLRACGLPEAETARVLSMLRPRAAWSVHRGKRALGVRLPELATTLAAAPTRAELAGSSAAAAAFRRGARAGASGAARVRLSPGAAAVLASLGIGMSGVALAAYAGVLPPALQRIAHTVLHAPPGRPRDRPSNRPVRQHPVAGVIASLRS